MDRRFVTLAIVLSGCGLVVDLDPPDPIAIDGGSFDASFDAPSTIDAARIDAPGEPDATACGPCDDRIDCTHDVCADGACTHVPDDTTCTDGRLGRCDPLQGCVYECTGDGDCRDGESCTDDLCVGGTCVFEPRTGPCDDGNACTSGDACFDGSCIGGTSRACADGDPCTDDACDPTSGDCVFRTSADGTLCSPGDMCRSEGRCSAGTCRTLTTACVEVADDCLTETCDPALGCVSTPLPARTGCGRGAGTCDRAGNCCVDGVSRDCDGDGICECSVACAAGECPLRCVDDAACAVGSTCCRDTGRCYDPACLSCCMTSAG